MGFATLAVFVIIAGFVVRSMPTKAGGASQKLVGYLLMVVGIGLFFMNAVVLVGVGEVGVQHFLGSVKTQPLEQGVHVINPLASVERMSTRKQAVPDEFDGIAERYDWLRYFDWL